MVGGKRRKMNPVEESSPQPNKLDIVSGVVSKADAFQLLNLPDDELKIVLGYLGHQDKKNLKLTSKSGEKRVIDLDPAMRRFNIDFSGVSYLNEEGIDISKETKLTLSKAKKRHLLSGNLDKINIMLSFYCVKFSTDYMNLAEEIINEWKDNIVHLRLQVSGLESYFLDSNFGMSKLNSLDLFGEATDKENFTKEEESANDVHKEISTKKVVSTLLQRHAETLEELTLVGLDPVIPPDLNLIKLTAYKVQTSVVISVLKASQTTLKELDLNKLQEDEDLNQIKFSTLKVLNTLVVENVSLDMVAMLIKSSMSTLENLKVGYFNNSVVPSPDLNLFNSLKLKLKIFGAINVPVNVIETILRLSSTTLWKFAWDDLRDGALSRTNGTLSHNFTQLESLKEFIANDVNSNNVAEILRCSRKSLTFLHIENIHWTWVKLVDFNFGPEPLNLVEFHALYVQPSIVSAVIKACKASLDVLRMEDCVGDVFDFQSDELPKLKIFTLMNTRNYILESVIEAAHNNLESLNVARCDPNNMEEFRLGKSIFVESRRNMPLPKLKEFRASGVSAEIAATIIKLSDKSLKHLDLSYCDFDTEVDYSSHFQSKKLVLEKMKIDGVTSKFVSRLIKCSQETLKHLEWEDCKDRIQLNQVKFKQLEHFEGTDMLSSIASAVIKAADSTLKNLWLKDICDSSGEIIDAVKIKIVRDAVEAKDDAEAHKDTEGHEDACHDPTTNIEAVQKFSKSFKSKFKKLFDVITDMLNYNMK